MIEKLLKSDYKLFRDINISTSQIQENLLFYSLISTPIGTMISIYNDNYLLLLEFIDRKELDKKIEKLKQRYNAIIINKTNDIFNILEKELALYFARKLTNFTIPIHYNGSQFQEQVWGILRQIPFGETRSYKNIANLLGDNNKVRAVGNANGLNQLVIVIPCHRVIKSTGQLGGYGGGVDRKQYLLNLEQLI